MKKLDKIDIIVIALTALALWYFIPRGNVPSTTPAKPAAAATPGEAAPKVENAEPGAKPANPDAAPVAPAEKPEIIEFSNEAVKYTFSSAGAGIQSAEIQAAPYAGKTPQALNVKSEGVVGGLSRVAGELDKTIWVVKEKTDKSVTFEQTKKDGLVITKKWSMVEGSDVNKGPGYIWNLKISLKNTGAEKVTADNFYLYTGTATQLHGNDGIYVSAGIYGDGKGREIKTDEFNESKFLGFLWQRRPEQTTITETLGQLTWVGVNSQYYSTLISPQTAQDGKLWARRFWNSFKDGDKQVSGWAMHAGAGLPTFGIESGKDVSYDYQVYMGPRSGTLLGKVEGDRVEAMFYGMTGALSKIFLTVLNAFNSWTGSFGVAIILLTICVRIAIWPLHIKATRSMKRMGLLAPMMTEIKARYKEKPTTPENQRKMQVEMMGLYREYNVSPLGGCLPLLLQMPIFFGYFGMLNHAVEMRGHSFLWAKDLTLPDTIFTIAGFPINPLPLIMTLTMFIQMKLQPSPPTTDDNQRMQMKIMKFMPVMFLLFCYGYASALALYWTVQNIVSIGQTYLVKRMPEPQLTKREVRKLPPVSGAGGRPGAKEEKPKGPPPPRTGGGGKSAFKG